MVWLGCQYSKGQAGSLDENWWSLRAKINKERTLFPLDQCPATGKRDESTCRELEQMSGPIRDFAGRSCDKKRTSRPPASRLGQQSSAQSRWEERLENIEEFSGAQGRPRTGRTIEELGGARSGRGFEKDVSHEFRLLAQSNNHLQETMLSG